MQVHNVYGVLVGDGYWVCIASPKSQIVTAINGPNPHPQQSSFMIVIQLIFYTARTIICSLVHLLLCSIGTRCS